MVARPSLSHDAARTHACLLSPQAFMPWPTCPMQVRTNIQAAAAREAAAGNREGTPQLTDGRGREGTPALEGGPRAGSPALTVREGSQGRPAMSQGGVSQGVRQKAGQPVPQAPAQEEEEVAAPAHQGYQHQYYDEEEEFW